MTAPDSNQPPIPDAEHFNRALVSGLLRIAVDEKQRPVDHLIARLAQSDASSWFDGAIRMESVSNDGDLQAMLIAGDADLERLNSMKDAAKKIFSTATESDQRNTGLLHYLLVIAAGLEHHGQLLSSQPRGELSAVLLELALSLPAPWNDFVAEAAMTPTPPTT
jgi:hypothetical protein